MCVKPFERGKQGGTQYASCHRASSCHFRYALIRRYASSLDLFTGQMTLNAVGRPNLLLPQCGLGLGVCCRSDVIAVSSS
jgi:hypothetical protein